MSKKKNVNIQSVIKMKKKQQDHMVFPKMAKSYKILINIVSSYFELSRASLFN